MQPLDLSYSLNNILDNSEDWLKQAALVAVIVLSAEQAQHDRNADRQRTRTYLRCTELLRSLKLATPWLSLYKSHSNHAYITTMGIDTNTFEYLLSAGFEEWWNIQGQYALFSSHDARDVFQAFTHPRSELVDDFRSRCTL